MIQNRMNRKHIGKILLLGICAALLVQHRRLTFSSRATGVLLLATAILIGSLLSVQEPFQIRGQVGSERSASRRQDKQGNPIRTCADDTDCQENETRTSCQAAICREPSMPSS